MNILPILAVGGAILFLGKKKKKKKKPTTNGSAALPPTQDDPKPKKDVIDVPPSLRFLGADPPDIIKGDAGIIFSVSFEGVAGTGYAWSLASSPPDNSIEVVSREGAKKVEGMPGGGEVTTFILKGAKPGYGSLVFHYQQPWMAGKAPPEQVVEIQTEIS